MFNLFKRKQKKNVLPEMRQADFLEDDSHTLKMAYPHQYSQGQATGVGSKPKDQAVFRAKLAQDMFVHSKKTVIEIAKELKVSRSQVYTYLGDLVKKRPRSKNV